MSTELKNIPLTAITPDPNQPRKFYDETAMAELVQSVQEKGILQPILVRLNGEPDHYLLVCGERRFKAAQRAGLDEIPAVVRILSDDEALEMQIIENLQRKDVHPMEEAVAFKSLLENPNRKLTLEEVAVKVGKSDFFVRQRLKLNTLIKQWQEVYYQNKLSAKAAVRVAALGDEMQLSLFNDKKNGDQYKKPDYVFDISNWDLERRRKELNKAPFDKKDPTLNPKMGACTGCQFNSAVACLFPEDAKDPVCNLPACFVIKIDNHMDRKVKEVLEDPAIVLVDNENYRYGDSMKVPIIDKLKKDGHIVYSYPNNEYRRVNTSDKSYKKGLETGKVLKAFVVAGHEAGEHIYIELIKNKAVTSKVLDAKMSAGNVAASDIDNEIDRIKDREKRSKELDGEKMWRLMRELIPSNGDALYIDKPLTPVEMTALAQAIETKTTMSERISKAFPKRGNDKWVGVTQEDLLKLFRIFMLDVLVNAYGSHIANKTSNGLAYEVMKQYLPEPIAKIEADQAGRAERRGKNVDARLSVLKKQKGELKAAAPKKVAEKKAPAKKAKAK